MDSLPDIERLTRPLRAEQSQFALRIRPKARLTPAALYLLCRRYADLRIEQTSEGDLIIMPPTGGKTGRRNLEITASLAAWTKRDGTGVAFDSSTGFMLPNGAERSPDAAWVTKQRWDALTPEQQDQFPPLCPDFVVELVSPSDALAEVHAKMHEWIGNGARAGWLIDPRSRRVWVYGKEGTPACLEDAASVAGDPVLVGFVLDLTAIW